MENVYEFTTPSDQIHFIASDDKIAYLCTVILGHGKAFCTNVTTGVTLPTFLAFTPNADEGEESHRILRLRSG